MNVAIHQPNYLPWIGYFHKMINCDLFVFLDDALYNKGSVINRNKVRTPHGWQYLTVPVKSRNILRKKICEVEIYNGTDWGKKHFKTLYYCYRRAQYFSRYKPFFERLYDRKWNKLAQLNEEIIYYLAEQFGVETRFVKASDFNVEGFGVERIINICKDLGADVYYSGIGAKAYQDEGIFAEEGIKLVYQDFKHPVYKQLFGEFIPKMSVVDLLFNCGPRSRDILSQAG